MNCFRQNVAPQYFFLDVKNNLASEEIFCDLHGLHDFCKTPNTECKTPNDSVFSDNS